MIKENGYMKTQLSNIIKAITCGNCLSFMKRWNSENVLDKQMKKTSQEACPDEPAELQGQII